MKITAVERSFEQCTESGWTGWHLRLDGKCDDDLVQALAPLGALTYMKHMARPFFLVQNEHFLVRGLVGDTFIKAGLKNNDQSWIEHIRAAVEGRSS